MIHKILWAIPLACLASSPVHAFSRATSPNIIEGEMEFEYSGSRTLDSDKAKDNKQEHEFEVEYGLTDRIGVELGAEYEREYGSQLKIAAAEFGVKYQFTEQGEMWVDAGLALSFVVNREAGTANEVEAKLLLEKQVGKVLNTANIGLEQEVGPYASGGPERKLVWSSRYRHTYGLEPGFEIQSEFGKGNETNRFSEQEHYIGPALYGRIMPGLKYEAAYLFGVSDAAVDGGARVYLEYELFF